MTGENQPEDGVLHESNGRVDSVDQSELTLDDVVEIVEKLDAKQVAFRDALRNAWDKIDALEEQLETAREDRRRLESENEELRGEIQRLDARTNLLEIVQDSDDLTARQRRVVLIQHLKKSAEQSRQNSDDAKASVNHEEAKRALQYPDIDRTTIYDDLREAPRLIGNENVLWYDNESGEENRLKLNLDAGDLPGDIVGERVQRRSE